MATDQVTCKQFAHTLIARAEHLDTDIIKDVLPWDPWVGDVSTGQFSAYDGTEHTFDRINTVYPDLTGAWEDLPQSSCIGQPCHITRKEICYGYTRDSYKVQRRGYKSPLFCFDQIMTFDRAKEQFATYVNALRPISTLITGDRMRLEAMRISTKRAATATMPTVTATWNSTMTRLTLSTMPTSCLTGEMLMREYQPQVFQGYFGPNPTNTTQLVVCKTDLDTIHRIQYKAADNNHRWRFEDFTQGAREYFKFGWSCLIGNFAVKAELSPMRFNIVDEQNGILERVFPYTNGAATGGKKRDVNPDYEKARVQYSQVVWHSQAMRVLGFNPEPVNPEMPFLMRDLAGKWVFAMHDLGTDDHGCVIENPLENQGRFYADFYLGTKAERPEWAVGIFHLREQLPITIDEPTSTDPGYPAQTYDSACDGCDHNLHFTPTLSANNVYVIAANTITCNGVPIVHNAISSADLATLADDLNTNVSILGTWAVDGTQISLADAQCGDVEITWVA